MLPMLRSSTQGDCSASDPYADYEGSLLCLTEGAGARQLLGGGGGGGGGGGTSQVPVHSSLHAARLRLPSGRPKLNGSPPPPRRPAWWLPLKHPPHPPAR